MESPAHTTPSHVAYARLFVLAVVALGLLTRAATVSSPLFDFHSWRQADTASIARNFVEERFNPFYPQIDQRGSSADGYVETGLELYAFVIAAVSKVVGFSPAIGRVVNTLLFPLAALLLFRFIRDRHGEAAGVVGLFLYALGMPLVVYIDRAFMNESLLLLLSIACLRSAQEYLRRRVNDGVGLRPAGPLIAMIATSSVIAMVKPTFLIVWAPVGGLFLERFGKKGFVRPELWLMCAISIALGGAWFRHAHTLYETTGLTFGISDKLFTPELLQVEYASKVVVRLVKDILGPVGVAFGIYGLVVAIKAGKFAEALGVVAFLFYLIVVTPGNFHHNYYQLPIVPVAASLAALGVATAIDRRAAVRRWTADQRVNAFAVIFAIALLTTFMRSVSAHNWYEVDYTRVEMCDMLAPVVAPEERVVFANYLSPDILFCIDRKGWLLEVEETTPERLRELAREGAVVFVTERKYEETVAALREIAPPLIATRAFVAHRLGATTRN